MTDNQDPVKTLQKIVDDKEKLSPPPPESNQEQSGETRAQEGQSLASSGELTPEQQAAQLEAEKAEKEAALAHIKDLEEQQATKDQEAILALRDELPEVAKATLINHQQAEGGGDLSNNGRNPQNGKNEVPKIYQLVKIENTD